MTISLSDFNNLSEKEKQITLTKMKNELSINGIIEAWGISRAKIYKMFKEFNVPVEKRGGNLANRKPAFLENNNKDLADTHEDTTVHADQTNDLNKMSSKKRDTIKSSWGKKLSQDSSKFSFSIETQGSGSMISETLQALLASSKISNAHFQVNISMQEI